MTNVTAHTALDEGSINLNNNVFKQSLSSLQSDLYRIISLISSHVQQPGAASQKHATLLYIGYRDVQQQLQLTFIIYEIQNH